MRPKILYILIVTLLCGNSSAKWSFPREVPPNNAASLNDTSAVNTNTYGFNITTNICQDYTVRAQCCDVYPEADNCPVGEGRENTSTYDSGAPLEQDYSGDVTGVTYNSPFESQTAAAARNVTAEKDMEGVSARVGEPVGARLVLFSAVVLGILGLGW